MCLTETHQAAATTFLFGREFVQLAVAGVLPQSNLGAASMGLSGKMARCVGILASLLNCSLTSQQHQYNYCLCD